MSGIPSSSAHFRDMENLFFHQMMMMFHFSPQYLYSSSDFLLSVTNPSAMAMSMSWMSFMTLL